jgi:hypothetical protein
MHIYTTHAPAEMSRTTSPRKMRSEVNARGGDWDCVRQMQMFRHRPDVLASALRDMGVTENGDEVLADGAEPDWQP